MRSGRGKCPQCKEMIVVDLEAPEIRCPHCNALLKKSQKTVAEARAEEEARVAAALARERALAGETEEVAAPADVPAEAPAEEPTVAPAEEVVTPTVAEEVPAEPTEETPAESAEEAPAEQPVDEVGISNEELASMDEALPTEDAIEPAPAEEAVDEIGLSDEELAALDADVPAEEAESAEPVAEDAPAMDAVEEAPIEIEIPEEEASASPAEDFVPTASVSAEEPDEADEADGADGAEEEEPTEEGAEDSALGTSSVVLADEETDLPADLIEEPEAIAEPEAAEEPELADVPVEVEGPEAADVEAPVEIADVPAEATEPADIPVDVEEPEAVEVPAESEFADVPVEVEELPADAEEAAAAELPQEAEDAEEPNDEAEAPTLEEAPVEIADAPAEEISVEDVPAEPDAYVPTEEDMAFAASLSDGVGTENNGATEKEKKGFVAPITNGKKPVAKKSDEDTATKKKSKAPKGEEKMDEISIYKKPVAFLMMILAIVAAAFYFLYYRILAIGMISEDLMLKLAEKLPQFGGDKFTLLVPTIFIGLITVISILGLTGRHGKLGFLFVLLSSLVYIAAKVLPGYVTIDKLNELIISFAEYIDYAIYGLLALGAIFFAISIGAGKDDLEYSGGTAILPLLYLALAIAGYVGIVVLPKILADFTVSASLLRYSIIGVWGVAILLTLIGVHSATASRGANAWLLFASAMICVLLFAAKLVLEKFGADKGLDTQEQIFLFVSPVIALFPLAGFAASDLRN